MADLEVDRNDERRSRSVSIDWDALTYTKQVAQSLLCPVCKNVLLTPLQTSCRYKHTLCARCITRALDERLECPVDRSAMPKGLEECTAVPMIVQQILDDLEVECPNEGCGQSCSRAMISMHLKEDCPYQAVSCPDPQCSKLILRHQSLGQECLHRTIECEHCFNRMMEKDLAAHLNECSELSHACCYCESEFNVEEFRAHQETCSERPMQCRASSLGCNWQGLQKDVQRHCEICDIEKIRPWLVQQEARISKLELENRSLKNTVNQLTTSDSADTVIEVSSEYERDRNYLFQSLATISGNVEDLSTSVSAIDSKNNHILLTESMRSKEEINMLRANLQALRMQFHHLLHNTRGPIAIGGQIAGRGDEDGKQSPRVSPTRSQTGDSSRVKL